MSTPAKVKLDTTGFEDPEFQEWLKAADITAVVIEEEGGREIERKVEYSGKRNALWGMIGYWFDDGGPAAQNPLFDLIEDDEAPEGEDDAEG